MKRAILLHVALFPFLLLTAGCFAYGPAHRVAYADSHPELSSMDREAILAGQIYMGCSRDLLIASWGQPRQVHRTVTEYGVHEQFVYGTYSRYGSPVFVYVKDGVVTSWQN